MHEEFKKIVQSQEEFKQILEKHLKLEERRDEREAMQEQRDELQLYCSIFKPTKSKLRDLQKNMEQRLFKRPRKSSREDRACIREIQNEDSISLSSLSDLEDSSSSEWLLVG